MNIEIEREEDGLWIAEISDLSLHFMTEKRSAPECRRVSPSGQASNPRICEKAIHSTKPGCDIITDTPSI